MIVYFSGTGNSAWCAHWLAERLEDEVVDAGRLMKADEVGRLSSRKPWVFVAPTYSWQLPDVFARWLRTCSFAGSFRAYFVLTCGSDIGNAGSYLEALCHDLGFVYQGVLPVVMPENYLALFPVPGEEEARGIIAAARPTLEEGLERIRTNDTFPPGPDEALRPLQVRPGPHVLLLVRREGPRLPHDGRLRRLRQMCAGLSAQRHRAAGRPAGLAGALHPLHGVHHRLSEGGDRVRQAQRRPPAIPLSEGRVTPPRQRPHQKEKEPSRPGRLLSACQKCLAGGHPPQGPVRPAHVSFRRQLP